MSQNFSRVPPRFLQHNQDLVKSQEGMAGQRKGTDYSHEVDVATVPDQPRSSYRTPPDRISGNQFFRRYVTGQLDYQYACGKVVDAIHSVRANDGYVHHLNNEQRVALGILFPESFNQEDPGMLPAVAAVQYRLSPMEVQTIRRRVAAHLAEELNWNAGIGGGSVPGRSQTTS